MRTSAHPVSRLSSARRPLWPRCGQPRLHSPAQCWLHLCEHLPHHCPDRSKRALAWNTRFRGNVAEHRFLLRTGSLPRGFARAPHASPSLARALPAQCRTGSLPRGLARAPHASHPFVQVPPATVNPGHPAAPARLLSRATSQFTHATQAPHSPLGRLHARPRATRGRSAPPIHHTEKNAQPTRAKHPLSFPHRPVAFKSRRAR